MRIFNVNCLHSGDWVAAGPQFREDLKREGRLTSQFPAHHNGAWMWTQTLRELGHEVIEFDYRTNFIVKKELQARYPSLQRGYANLVKKFSRLAAFDTGLINRNLITRARVIKPDIFITYPGERIYPETIINTHGLDTNTFVQQY